MGRETVEPYNFPPPQTPSPWLPATPAPLPLLRILPDRLEPGSRANRDGAVIMKLVRVEIENYRAIEALDLELNSNPTVLYGKNAHGKTSVLSAIATGLGSIPMFLPDVSSVGFRKSDRRGLQQLRVGLTAVGDIAWDRRVGGSPLPRRRGAGQGLKETINAIVNADREGTEPLDLPIVAFYDTDRAVFDQPQRRRGFKAEFPRYGALQDALSARTDFRDFFKWFYAKENMVPGARNSRIKLHPLRFVVSVQLEGGELEELSSTS